MKIFQAIFLKNNGKTAGSVGFKDQEELIQRLESGYLGASTLRRKQFDRVIIQEGKLNGYISPGKAWLEIKRISWEAFKTGDFQAITWRP